MGAQVNRFAYRLIPVSVLIVILIGLSIGPVPISLLQLSATDKDQSEGTQRSGESEDTDGGNTDKRRGELEHDGRRGAQ